MTRLGIISDTHNVLLPCVEEALQGCDYIVHAGDVTSLKVLRRLEAIAPVSLARGNCDYSAWALDVPVTEVLEVENVNIYILHNLDYLDIDPATSGFAMVVYGHTHVAKMVYQDDVLYLNPGSASQPRGGQPVSIAVAEIEGEKIDVRSITFPGEARCFW